MPKRIDFKSVPGLGDLGDIYLGIPGMFLSIANKAEDYILPVRLHKREIRIGYTDAVNDYGWDYKENEIGRIIEANHGSEPWERTNENSTLSMNHCVLIIRGKEGTVMDLESRTGTYLNGKRISPRKKYGERTFRDGDIIGLIPYEGRLIIQIQYRFKDVWEDEAKEIFLRNLKEAGMKGMGEEELTKDMFSHPGRYMELIEDSLKILHNKKSSS